VSGNVESATRAANWGTRFRIILAMSKWARMVFVLTVTLMAVCGWSQSPQIVDVVDKSEFQDVVQYVGHVSFSERFVGNQLISSCVSEISARNVSSKPIVLYIGSLTEEGPHGGCNMRRVFQYDNVFSAPVEPQDAFEVALSPSAAERYASCCHNPLESPEDPKAELRTLYIEFADGSTVGDKRMAKDVLRRREAILTGLRQLDSAYKAGGQTAFAALLNTEFAGDANWFFDSIRAMAKSSGYEAAFEQARKYLAAAERNAPTSDDVRR
jgi:hypothetical protein